MKRARAFSTAAFLAVAAINTMAQSDVPGVNPRSGIPSSQMPAVLASVSYDQRLNEQLPLDLPFRDEEGRQVKLGDYFGA